MKILLSLVFAMIITVVITVVTILNYAFDWIPMLLSIVSHAVALLGWILYLAKICDSSKFRKMVLKFANWLCEKDIHRNRRKMQDAGVSSGWTGAGKIPLRIYSWALNFRDCYYRNWKLYVWNEGNFTDASMFEGWKHRPSHYDSGLFSLDRLLSIEYQGDIPKRKAVNQETGEIIFSDDCLPSQRF